MTKYNSKMKRKSENCSNSQDLNGTPHVKIDSEANIAYERVDNAERVCVKGSMFNRPKVTSVGGESIMLILLLLPLSGNMLNC